MLLQRVQRKIASLRSWLSLTPEQRVLRKLQYQSYDDLQLSSLAEGCIQKVFQAAQEIYQDRWNYYSNALRREVVYTFERASDSLKQGGAEISYLEIGSAQGLSMSFMGLMLKELGILGDLVSVDPYFESGYEEGEKGIWSQNVKVEIDKKTRDRARSLYDVLQLPVELIERESIEGLKALIDRKQKFHLIYVDGSHEGLIPTLDFGLSCQLLHPNGVIMLDDHHWPDVKAIKVLCDKHCEKIHESWKVAAYRIAL